MSAPPATLSGVKPDPDAPARDKVLFQLKTKGPQTAGQLARRLGVTAMAVRQHLQRLEEDGLACFEEERRPVGRPAKVWRPTEQAEGRFPDSHADLTVQILEGVRSTFGEDGLERLMRHRYRRQRALYRKRIARDAPLRERVAKLAAVRREEGYMAEWSRQRDGSLLLVENHCPICAAARTCQGLCRDELALFQSVLGREVVVERTEHILSGARRCAYLIRPRS